MPSANTAEMYRNKFKTVHGIKLNDDEIARFHHKLMIISIPAIIVMIGAGGLFIVVLIAMFTRASWFGDAEPGVFVGSLMVLFCVAGVMSMVQAKLEAAFAGEVKRARPDAIIPVPSTPPVAPPAGHVVYSTGPAPNQVIMKETVKESVIVKVRCQFCGALVDQGVPDCPNCGGRM